MKSIIPKNIAGGSGVEKIKNPDPEIAFKRCFEYAQEKIKDDGILFIVDEDFTPRRYSSRAMKKLSTPYRHTKRKIDQLKCKCRDKTNLIVLKYIFENEQRKCPLFQFKAYSSGKENIKAQMKNPQEKQDIIVPRDLARGYEFGFVVNLTDTKHISRSTSYAVRMDPDMSLGSAKNNVIDAILSDDYHNCQKIMEDGIILNLGNRIRSLQSGLKLSKELFWELHYHHPGSLTQSGPAQTNGSNPILKVIADQTRLDSEWKNENFNESNLLKKIKQLSKKGKIIWNSTTIKKKSWMKKIQGNHAFYHEKKNIREHEEILFDLLSQTLNRKINVYPRFPNSTSQPKVFEPSSVPESAMEYHILAADKLGYRNYFCSLVKKESSQNHTEENIEDRDSSDPDQIGVVNKGYIEESKVEV